MSKPTRRALRLHDVVKHPEHKGRGEVIELVTSALDAKPWAMALVTWPREHHATAWVAPERCQLVKSQKPSQRRNRALRKRIAKAGTR
jgi:hypothetical protein